MTDVNVVGEMSGEVAAKLNELLKEAVARMRRADEQEINTVAEYSAVALAHGLTAADMTAFMAFQNKAGQERLMTAMENLFNDMRHQAQAAYAHFATQSEEVANG